MASTDWAALARSLWRSAQISVHAPGPHAVVVRCHSAFPDVHLFADFDEARAFEAKACCPSCRKKHTYGPITGFVPAPPPVRTKRWNPEAQRD